MTLEYTILLSMIMIIATAVTGAMLVRSSQAIDAIENAPITCQEIGMPPGEACDAFLQWIEDNQ